MLKAVYRLLLRAAEGLLVSVLGLLTVDFPVPDFTTLSRRLQTLMVCLPRHATKEPLHLAFIRPRLNSMVTANGVPALMEVLEDSETGLREDELGR